MLVFDKQRENYQVLGYKQFDNEKPIEAQFFDYGQAIDLSQYYIRFECKKSDGNIVIDDENIVIKNTNTIEMMLNNQVTVVSGEVECQFVLIHKNNEKQNTTFTFDIDIQKSVIENGGYSESVITIAEKLNKDIINAKEIHEDIIEDIAKIESTGNTEITIKATDWTKNGEVYEKKVTHNLNSENLLINARNGDKEAIHLAYKILDKNTVLFKNDLAENVSIILSARYYKPLILSEVDEGEIVNARGQFATLNDRFLNIEKLLNIKIAYEDFTGNSIN